MKKQPTKKNSPTTLPKKEEITKVKRIKTKAVACLGCYQPWVNQVYNDGSYHHFYQDLKTKQYFCSNCVQNEPVEEPIHYTIFRNGKYFNREGQELCAQCKEANLNLTREFNQKWYCQDCIQWQEEASYSGIASCYRYENEINCGGCGCCEICQERSQIKKISSLTLLAEAIQRGDLQALITWEDDDFQHRFQELIWELAQVKGKTPTQISKEVNEEIIGKKCSQRKVYSRGV